jgi:peptidoglycan/xylan/chitin deacetylase (PgdA/CDA1 family)
MRNVAITYSRLVNASRRFLVQRYARRIALKRDAAPYVSFTFDDFPKSALVNGGNILKEYGAHGTYYVSMGLLGCDSPSGTLADADDIGALLAAWHELGCHTFDHLDGMVETTDRMLESIRANQRAVLAVAPGTVLRTFAYPINEPRIRTKQRIGDHFLCCRAGGQTYNRRRIDMNMVHSCFLDSRNRDDLPSIKRLIDESRKAGGWLVFSTHDVQEYPSRYGCTEQFFRDVVSYCASSGARILEVVRACQEMGVLRRTDIA